MDSYLDCAQQPLFEGNKYINDDQLASSAAFWTVVSGYKLNRPDSALKYHELALSSRNYRRRALPISLGYIFDQRRYSKVYRNIKSWI